MSGGFGYPQRLCAMLGLCVSVLLSTGQGATTAPAAPVRPITDKAVFFDPHYDTYYCSGWPETTAYFGRRGFTVLDTPKLVAWMKQRTARGAYGSVCVMTSGVTPDALFLPLGKKNLLYTYMAAGGRIVVAAGHAFYWHQGPTGAPRRAPKALQEMLGLSLDMKLVNYGPCKPTAAGRAWGLSQSDRGTVCNPVESVDVALVVSTDGKVASVSLKNVNPRFPLSGLVAMHRYVRPQDKLLAEIYCLAMYTGQPVRVPEPTPVAKPPRQLPLDVTLSTKPGSVERRAYVRGESIPLGVTVTNPGDKPMGQHLVWRLLAKGRSLWQRQMPLTVAGADTCTLIAAVDTRPWAVGAYELEAVVRDRGRAVGRARTDVWICPARPANEFPIAPCLSVRPNRYRQEMTVKDLAEHHLNADIHGPLLSYYRDAQTVASVGAFVDTCLRYRLWCMMRHMPKLPSQGFDKSDYRVLPNGKLKPDPFRAGKPGMHGLAVSEKMRQGARETVGRAIALARQMRTPALRPYFTINDDWSMFGGPDWSPQAMAAFEKHTGIPRATVPKPRMLKWYAFDAYEGAHPAGVVDDNDPYLRYMHFLSRSYGRVNAAIMSGAQAAWPGCRVGEIPGSMCWPVLMTSRSMYALESSAPLTMSSYYNYVSYWTPLVANVFWREAANMGNRDKPTDITTDCRNMSLGPPYHRETFYLLLAAGTQGLHYFSYAEIEPGPVYDEVARLAGFAARYARLLARMKPARPTIAQLVSFTQNCYRHSDVVSSQLFAFANLLLAQGEVGLVAEEEAAAGMLRRYPVVVLNNLTWVSRTAHEALVAYVKAGGTIVADEGTGVAVPGATRVKGRFASGTWNAMLPDRPNQTDYGDAPSLALARRVVQQHAAPWARCRTPSGAPTDNVVVRRFSACAQPLVWLVNVESHQEYIQLKLALTGKHWRTGPGKYVADLCRKQARVRVDLSVPAGAGAAYDLQLHRPIVLAKRGDRLHGQVTLQRFGGTLVAFYPEPIARVRLAGSTQVRQGSQATVVVTVEGPSGKPLPGCQPLHVEVFYPDGSPASEYTNHDVAENGLAVVAIPVARNEPTGPWRVRVTELAGNHVAEARLEVVK